MATNLSDDELQKLYAWIDSIPLSRPKRNINRDFSDGVLAAEVVAYYFPRLVDIHNYSAANSTQQKMYNWNTFNTKVLRKLKYQMAPSGLEDLIHGKPGAVEVFLHNLQYKMAKYKAAKEEAQAQPQQSNSGHHYRQAGAAGSNYSNNYSDDDGPPSPCTPSRLSPTKRHLNAAQAGGLSPAAPKSGERERERRHTPTTTHAAAESIGGGRVSGMGGSVRSSSRGRERHRQHPTSMSSAQQQGRNGRDKLQKEVDEEILLEKEETIQELRETVEILEMKMAKLEQLVRLKDNRIQRLQEELARVNALQPQSPGDHEGLAEREDRGVQGWYPTEST